MTDVTASIAFSKFKYLLGLVMIIPVVIQLDCETVCPALFLGLQRILWRWATDRQVLETENTPRYLSCTFRTKVFSSLFLNTYNGTCAFQKNLFEGLSCWSSQKYLYPSSNLSRQSNQCNWLRNWPWLKNLTNTYGFNIQSDLPGKHRAAKYSLNKSKWSVYAGFLKNKFYSKVENTSNFMLLAGPATRFCWSVWM